MAVVVRSWRRCPVLALVAAAGLCGLVAARHGGGGNGLIGVVAIWLAAASVLGLMGVPRSVRDERLRRSGIAEIDAMSGVDFERRLEVVFQRVGYAVRPTAATGDFGADLLLECQGARTVVQAKRYRGAVGIEAVQQVIGARRYYSADVAMLVTNSTCTPAAVALAVANEVRLVEREGLIDLLASVAGDQRGPSGALLLGRQLIGGIALLLYALSCVLRGGWRLLRLASRLAGLR